MQQDERWFRDMYARRYAAVFAYASRRVDASVAADVVAETFLVAWRQRPRLTESTELPWLYTTAKHVVANTYRSDRRRAALATRVISLMPERENTWTADQTSSVDAAIDVQRALRNLSDLDREALLLTSWEDLSIREAAAVAECSESAFKVRLHRARQRFTAELESAALPPQLLTAQGDRP